jgi:hypothetical protein
MASLARVPLAAVLPLYAAKLAACERVFVSDPDIADALFREAQEIAMAFRAGEAYGRALAKCEARP